jgi:hypothetical protein
MNTDERSRESSDLIRSLQDMLVDTEDLEKLLSGVAAMAGKLLEPPASAGIAVRVGGRTVTAESTDGKAAAVPSWSVPLATPTEEVGRLDVYVDGGRRAVDPADQQRLEEFARDATPLIILAVRRAEQQHLNEQLVAALGSRTVIDQAIGVLMAQERCSAAAAFALLRKHSQNHNRKLRDVATEIVTRVTGHPPSDPAPFGRGGEMTEP